MLYRIGKPCRLPAAILAPKLLRPQDDRLCPVHLVQSVQHLVQPFHLLKLLRVKDKDFRPREKASKPL